MMGSIICQYIPQLSCDIQSIAHECIIWSRLTHSRTWITCWQLLATVRKQQPSPLDSLTGTGAHSFSLRLRSLVGSDSWKTGIPHIFYLCLSFLSPSERSSMKSLSAGAHSYRKGTRNLQITRNYSGSSGFSVMTLNNNNKNWRSKCGLTETPIWNDLELNKHNPQSSYERYDLSFNVFWDLTIYCNVLRIVGLLQIKL